MSPLSAAMLTVGYAAAALNIFYWFAGPVLAGAVTEITGVDAPWLRWPISVTVAVLTLLWIARTRVSELQFALTTGARTEPVLLGMPKRHKAPPPESAAQVRFEPDGTPVAAEVGNEPARHRRAVRPADRGGLPDGGVRGRPGRRPRRHVVSVAAGRGTN